MGEGKQFNRLDINLFNLVNRREQVKRGSLVIMKPYEIADGVLEVANKYTKTYPNGNEVVKAYTIFTHNRAIGSEVVSVDRLINQLILIKESGYPKCNIDKIFTNIRLKQNQNGEYEIEELEEIRTEYYFEYQFIMYGNIRGWRLRLLDYFKNSEFECPSELAGFPVISLSNTFNSKSPKFLNLKTLNLNKMQTENVVEIESMLSSLNNIEILRMGKCKFNTLYSAERFIKGCNNLRYIDIRNFKIPEKQSVEKVLVIDRHKSDLIDRHIDAKIDWEVLSNDKLGLCELFQLIINEETYKKLEQLGYKKLSKQGMENIQDQRNKAKILGVQNIKFIRADIV